MALTGNYGNSLASVSRRLRNAILKLGFFCGPGTTSSDNLRCFAIELGDALREKEVVRPRDRAGRQLYEPLRGSAEIAYRIGQARGDLCSITAVRFNDGAALRSHYFLRPAEIEAHDRHAVA